VGRTCGSRITPALLLAKGIAATDGLRGKKDPRFSCGSSFRHYPPQLHRFTRCSRIYTVGVGEYGRAPTHILTVIGTLAILCSPQGIRISTLPTEAPGNRN